LSVFGYLPVIAPSALATTDWSKLWPNWTASARASLADAFKHLRAQGDIEAAELHLSGLAADSHFGVRRSAVRSLSIIRPESLSLFGVKLSSSPDIGDRVRAAEMLPYLGTGTATACRELLHNDPVKRVREAVQQSQAIRRKAELAETYLERILGLGNPSREETLSVVKYVQALAEVGDDSTLSAVADDLTRNAMPSRVRHLKAWLHKELSQEWEKRRQKWPEPLLQVRGSVSTGTGSLTVQDKTVPARYEIRLAPSEQSTDQFQWDGEVFVSKTQVVDSELMDTDQWLTFEDGSRGRVHISGTHSSTAEPDIKLTVTGQGAFPQRA
jgi:hypothetical protein